MIIGTCLIELHLDGNASLKGKRAALKPLLARLHKEFNVSAAEVDHHDSWQAASIALACIANDPAHADQVLNNAVQWIEHHRPDVQVVDWQIEILCPSCHCERFVRSNLSSALQEIASSQKALLAMTGRLRGDCFVSRRERGAKSHFDGFQHPVPLPEWLSVRCILHD